AQTVGPSADYELKPEETSTSPDGKTTIEQYAKDDPNGGSLWQFWARRQDKLTLLNPEPADYPAGFRFTNDSQWLVRMQKTRSGGARLHFFPPPPGGFRPPPPQPPAPPNPRGDLAWAFFYRQRDARKVMKPDFHISAGLVKGTEENYRWMGETWPDSRYLVVTLWGSVSPTHRQRQIDSVRGWRCRYDLQKGTFDVPRSFAANNAKAIARNSKDQ